MGRAARQTAKLVLAPPAPLLKLDFGCGPHKREGFLGVDQTSFLGVDHVVDLTHLPWPWADGSVSEAYASHFLEHLTPVQRCGFANELHRILVPGGTCQIIVPHWAAARAYGDPTHQWPPVSEFWFFYLNADWRAANAPHTSQPTLPGGFTCHFAATWGYALRGDLLSRNQEFQQFAVANYKEVCQDIIAMLTKTEHGTPI